MLRDSDTYWNNILIVGLLESFSLSEVELWDLKMEGYTNIIGNQYDFDDLDIEGRVQDEWKLNPEDQSSSNLNVQKVFLLFYIEVYVRVYYKLLFLKYLLNFKAFQ